MSSMPSQSNPGHPRHPLLQRPLVIVALVVLAWLVVVVATDQLWRHAFGYPIREAWALSIGLTTYLTLFIGVMVGVVWILGHEHQRNA
jgi:hypothetical protein